MLTVEADYFYYREREREVKPDMLEIKREWNSCIFSGGFACNRSECKGMGCVACWRSCF